MLLDVADVTTLLWHVVVFFSEGAVGRGCVNVITDERWLAVSMATTRTSATLRPSFSHAQRRCDSGEDLSVTPPTSPLLLRVGGQRNTTPETEREKEEEEEEEWGRTDRVCMVGGGRKRKKRKKRKSV